MAKGIKTGGRRKGTLNRLTRETVALLKRLGCDPIEGMAKIALGDVPCGACRGIATDPPCGNCRGTGKESVPLELKAKMYVELVQYACPKTGQKRTIKNSPVPEKAENIGNFKSDDVNDLEDASAAMA